MECFLSKWLINSLLKLFCSIVSKLKTGRAGHLRNKVQGEISRKAGRFLQSVSLCCIRFSAPLAPPHLLFYSVPKQRAEPFSKNTIQALPSLINNRLFVVFKRKYKLLTMGFMHSSCTLFPPRPISPAPAFLLHEDLYPQCYAHLDTYS